jgi:hypothetical protein
MPETPRYTLHVKGNVEKATSDTSRVMNTGEAIAQLAKAPPPPMSARRFLRAWWVPLLGCSMSWFLLDIAFYSQNLFQKDGAYTLWTSRRECALLTRAFHGMPAVFDAVGWIPKASSMNALEETYKIARAQALIALGSTVPGYWFTVFFVDRLGRKPIQFGGFMLMTIFMAVLSGWYIPLRDSHQAGFVTMYALTFFFANCKCPRNGYRGPSARADASALFITLPQSVPTLRPSSSPRSCSQPPGRPRRTASPLRRARRAPSWAPSASCTPASRATLWPPRPTPPASACARRWACLQPSTLQGCCSLCSSLRPRASRWRS